jgi:hypothetical protein
MSGKISVKKTLFFVVFIIASINIGGYLYITRIFKHNFKTLFVPIPNSTDNFHYGVMLGAKGTLTWILEGGLFITIFLSIIESVLISFIIVVALKHN